MQSSNAVAMALSLVTTYGEKTFFTESKGVAMGKFELIATNYTRNVLLSVRKAATSFLLPQDFLTVSDFVFFLCHLMPTPSIFNKGA